MAVVLAYEPHRVFTIGGPPGGISPYAQALRQAWVETGRRRLLPALALATEGIDQACPCCGESLAAFPPRDER